MIKKNNGEWTLSSKDGKEELAKGNLKAVMAEDYKRKNPEPKGIIDDADKAIEKFKGWVRETIGRPKGGGLSTEGATDGFVSPTPPRKEKDAKINPFKRNPNWKQKGFKKQKP